MATSGVKSDGGGSGPKSGSFTREGSAKSMVADQISQAVQSTSNLLQLMLQNSPSQVLEQLPLVISSLDAHVEDGLQSVPHLKTVIQLLGNIESCQLKSLSHAQLSKEQPVPADSPPEAG